jgi:hypothetical protein
MIPLLLLHTAHIYAAESLLLFHSTLSTTTALKFYFHLKKREKEEERK